MSLPTEHFICRVAFFIRIRVTKYYSGVVYEISTALSFSNSGQANYIRVPIQK